MQRDAVWKLTTPTLGVSEIDDRSGLAKPTPIAIPAEALVKVLNTPASADTFVEVEWEQKKISMFRVDLRERGVKIESGTN